MPFTVLKILYKQILKGFDKGMITDMILIDLQKAFYAIGHDILLQKLCGIGFSKHSLCWCQSYLTNRLFLLNLGKEFS